MKTLITLIIFSFSTLMSARAEVPHRDLRLQAELAGVTLPHDAPRLVKLKKDSPAHGISRLTLVFQEGTNPLNRFELKIVKKARHSRHLRPRKEIPLLLVSPFSNTNIIYELKTGSKYTDSYAGNLVKNGVDVWMVSDRLNTTRTATACDAESGNDCGIMSTWGLAKRISDIEFVASIISLSSGGIKPVIGGNTGGGMAAIAAVNASPNKYRALYSTGALYSADPAVQARNQATCDAMKALYNSGTYWIDGLSGFIPLVDAAKNSPSEPSTVDPRLTNIQFLVALLSTPGALGTLAFTNDYIFAKGNISSGKFRYMNVGLFYQEFQQYGVMLATQHLADLSCGPAGHMTYTSNLGAFTGAVKFFVTGEAFGPLANDTAALFTHASKVSVVLNPIDGGEADNFIVADNARERVLDRPLLAWIKSLF